MTSPFESCRPRYCVPSEERATSKLSVMTRLQQVSSDAEEVLDKSMNGQESLGLTRRFEPSHLPFTLPRRLVRDLGPIVLVLVGAVDDGWHDLAVSGAVASQLVGDEPPGWPALPLQQLTKEAFSGSPIASRLDEDIDDVAILVHRTPEILPLTLDGYKHLVQVPRIAEATLPSLQPASVFWTELDAGGRPVVGSLRETCRSRPSQEYSDPRSTCTGWRPLMVQKRSRSSPSWIPLRDSRACRATLVGPTSPSPQESWAGA